MDNAKCLQVYGNGFVFNHTQKKEKDSSKVYTEDNHCTSQLLIGIIDMLNLSSKIDSFWRLR